MKSSPDFSRSSVKKEGEEGDEDVALKHARPAPKASALSMRVLLTAPFLMIANAWWITEIEYVSYSDNCTTQALYFNAISLLLLLLGVNAILRRISPARVFSPPL